MTKKGYSGEDNFLYGHFPGIYFHETSVKID